jgi:hypothetical protein
MYLCPFAPTVRRETTYFVICVLQAENAGFYPPELLALTGKYLLFKVDKSSAASVLFDGSYRVRRICSDPTVIEAFTLQGARCSDEQVVRSHYYSDLNMFAVIAVEFNVVLLNYIYCFG